MVGGDIKPLLSLPRAALLGQTAYDFSGSSPKRDFSTEGVRPHGRVSDWLCLFAHPTQKLDSKNILLAQGNKQTNPW